MDSEYHRRVIERFRAGAEIDGLLIQRDSLLLLTTVGRRSGKRHTMPMMFQRDGDRLLVVGSNAGSSRHPDWYLNLVKTPQVTVEVGDEAYDAVARRLDSEERAEVWPVLKARYPFLAEYQAKSSDRVIPVVALTRA
ncbi:MAG: nitroreductase family deazaflavin-dependent oxidoreductase [Kutzneria sp.]|nr:nitroreductase family deazaflavin-dependent oxidoreductase [Kutzneria sp.]